MTMLISYGSAVLDGQTQLDKIVKDPQGKVRTEFLSPRNEVLAVQETNRVGAAFPNGTGTVLTTRYTYDPLSQLIQVKDASANGNLTKAGYDSIGHLVLLVSPDAGQTEMRFDQSGRLAAKETALLRSKGLMVKYTYDINRLKTVVYPPALDAGDLAGKFDVLIFVDGGIPARDGGGGGGRGGGGEGFGGMPDPQSIPAEFRDRLGNVTVARTVPQLRQFLEAGGAILTIGSSTGFAYTTGLPIANALMEKQQDGSDRALTREKFYVPGSILQVRVDNTDPLAYGMPDKVDVFFDNSPVFRFRPEALMKGVSPVAWFDSDKPLRSGWAWGQKYLQDGVAVAEARVGKGKLFLFGPEIAFRGQPHGTFKFLFNGIYYGGAEPVTLK